MDSHQRNSTRPKPRRAVKRTYRVSARIRAILNRHETRLRRAAAAVPPEHAPEVARRLEEMTLALPGRLSRPHRQAATALLERVRAALPEGGARP